MLTFSTTNQSVGDIGYGLMGLTWHPPADMTDEKAFKCMRTALEQGCNFWNGGEFYGPPEANSLLLLNRYFAKYPEDASKVVLSIKGCIDLAKMAPDASPANVRRSVETCVSMLGSAKKIDFFEPARIDPNVPVEETVKALAEMIKEGKIGGYMLSEASGATVRRAHKVHPCSGVELEISLWATDPLTDGTATACAELGIPIVAYSPVGRGMLTGQIKTIEDIPEGSFMKFCPRFQPGAFEINIKLVDEVLKMAKQRNVTPAQLAIAWVQSRHRVIPGLKIISIPGSTKDTRIAENAGAKNVQWTDADEKEIQSILDTFEVVGGRYPEAQSKYLSL